MYGLDVLKTSCYRSHILNVFKTSRIVLRKKSFSRCLKIIRTNLTRWCHLQDLLLRYLKVIFLQTNWTRYIRRFVFELRCLCKGFRRYLKDIFKKLHQQSKKKTSTYIDHGNDETQTRKSLTLTQKPKRFDHKRYRGREILKFEFIFSRNNRDCDARWSMSFCLSTRMDNLLGMNQTKHLIRSITMIII